MLLRCIINDKTQVLYIEDDNHSQRLVSRILQKNGYQVHVASDGLEGVNMARTTKPNLILMDINLPYIDGRALTTRLRSLPHLSDTPIVALTADISDDSRKLALAAGCVGYLNKPVDVDKFPFQIAAFLQGQIQRLDHQDESRHLRQHAENIVEQLEGKIRELEEANQLLLRLDRMKSDFIVLASHELYTPLTLVSGYSNLMDEHLEQDDDKVSLSQTREVASLLGASVDRMQLVVQEIMNVARIAGGRLELSIGPVQLPQLIRSVRKSFREILNRRNLTLIVGNLDSIPMIFGDGSHLKAAIYNLVENAIKYTPDGGEISILAKQSGGGVEIAITDTGIGIPLEEQEQIFNQFYTLGNVDNHSSSKSAFEGGGMGLGLTIASGILEAHKGRVWVKSRGQDRDGLPGSTFYIWVPIGSPELEA